MKVKCVQKGSYGNHITTNKIYDVVEMDNIYYRIIDDSGNHSRYYRSRFAEVEESVMDNMFSTSEILVLKESLSLSRNHYQDLIFKAVGKGNIEESKTFLDRLEIALSLATKCQ